MRYLKLLCIITLIIAALKQTLKTIDHIRLETSTFASFYICVINQELTTVQMYHSVNSVHG